MMGQKHTLEVGIFRWHKREKSHESPLRIYLTDKSNSANKTPQNIYQQVEETLVLNSR